jgi:hypothetical protein
MIFRAFPSAPIRAGLSALLKAGCRLALLACLPLSLASAGEPHAFKLHGGYFFGPGPIVPDTALPDGAIRNIAFDSEKWQGVAAFAEGGRILSDGKTATNGNIDAGALEIGGPEAQGKGKGKAEGKTFWLYAVAGGPNRGEEHYRFDADYNMLWTVDLALDPGFPEGIVRVDGFELTTGTRTVPASLQTAAKQPGGYDKAGSLASGTRIHGRVGDFDADGFLDGVIVATANVPMQADLLPGAPVGNVRGFESDIPVDPLFALELTLHGIVNMQPLVQETLTGGHLDQLAAWLKDIQERLLAARANYESAFVRTPPEKRQELREIEWRLASIRQLIFIPLAFLTTYEFPSGNAPSSVVDATSRAFDKAEALAALLEKRRGGPPRGAAKKGHGRRGGKK